MQVAANGGVRKTPPEAAFFWQSIKAPQPCLAWMRCCAPRAAEDPGARRLPCKLKSVTLARQRQWHLATVGTLSRRNFAAGILTGFAVGVFLCFFFLDYRWQHAAPTSALPQLGLVYPHNEHSDTRYFSAVQATSGPLLFLIAIATFVVGFTIAPKKNIRTTRGWLSVSMRFDRDDPHNILIWSQLGGVILAPAFIFTVWPSIVATLNRLGFVFNVG